MEEQVSVITGDGSDRKPKARYHRTIRSGVRHEALSRPFSRVRSGVPTGRTPWFKVWMADLQARSVLQAMKLDYLAETLTGQMASTFAILRVNGRIKNVWQLSQSSSTDLLAIPQIGPARLEAVERYLTGRNVPLTWTVA